MKTATIAAVAVALLASNVSAGLFGGDNHNTQVTSSGGDGGNSTATAGAGGAGGSGGAGPSSGNTGNGGSGGQGSNMTGGNGGSGAKVNTGSGGNVQQSQSTQCYGSCVSNYGDQTNYGGNGGSVQGANTYANGGSNTGGNTDANGAQSGSSNATGNGGSGAQGGSGGDATSSTQGGGVGDASATDSSSDSTDLSFSPTVAIPVRRRGAKRGNVARDPEMVDPMDPAVLRRYMPGAYAARDESSDDASTEAPDLE